MVKWSKPVSVLGATLLLLLLSTGVNVLQAQRIHSLVSANPSVSSVVGRTVKSLTGLSLDGSPVDISLRADRPTVVYFFSSKCKFCDMNWTNIQALASAAMGRFRVVAVSTERGLRGYLAARHVTVEVLEGISDNTRESFGFSGTPHTVVVSFEGLVTHEWRGAYTPRMQRQIEDLFDVALPGPTSNSAAQVAGTR